MMVHVAFKKYIDSGAPDVQVSTGVLASGSAGPVVDCGAASDIFAFAERALLVA